MAHGAGRSRVRFDERVRRRHGAAERRGAAWLSSAQDQFFRHGVPLDRLRACQGDHPSGTSLPGCLKIYLPDSAGTWRILFQIAADTNGPLLAYLAGGVGHHPRGARAPTVYDIAHHRLHGGWPRRPTG